jgi:hypothetical protein
MNCVRCGERIAFDDGRRKVAEQGQNGRSAPVLMTQDVGRSGNVAAAVPRSYGDFHFQSISTDRSHRR